MELCLPMDKRDRERRGACKVWPTTMICRWYMTKSLMLGPNKMSSSVTSLLIFIGTRILGTVQRISCNTYRFEP